MDIEIRLFRPDELETIKQITVDAFEPVSIDRNIEDKFGTINGRDWKFRKARHIEEDVRRDPRGVFVAVAAGHTTW